jgi:hypothetical protein
LQHSREIKLRQAVHSRRQGISLASSESWSCQNLFSKVLIQIHQLYSECNLLFIPGVRQSLGSDKGSRWHHDRAGEAKLFSKVLTQIYQPYSECNLLFIRGDKGSRWHLQTAGAAKTIFESLGPNSPALFKMQPLVYWRGPTIAQLRQGISLAS